MNALTELNAATPGPWHVVPYGDGDSLVICSDQGGEWRICFMATHGGTESVWQAIQANARVIAAAPDLLAALQAVVANSDRLQEAGHRRRGDLNDLYDAAVAAIAKATGAAL